MIISQLLFGTAAVAQFNLHPCANFASFFAGNVVQEEAVAGAMLPVTQIRRRDRGVITESKVRYLNLDAAQRGVDALGFEFCSPIRANFAHTLNGNDAIGKAQTGTGKTAAFLIMIFNVC